MKLFPEGVFIKKTNDGSNEWWSKTSNHKSSHAYQRLKNQR